MNHKLFQTYLEVVKLIGIKHKESKILTFGEATLIAVEENRQSIEKIESLLTVICVELETLARNSYIKPIGPLTSPRNPPTGEKGK